MMLAARADEGATGAISEGSLALAEWIAAEGYPRALDLTLGGMRQCQRMLAGVMLPDRETGEALGAVTGGKVTAEAFRWPSTLTDAALIAVENAAASPEQLVPAGDETLCVVRGRLGGDAPSGKLFTATVDPVTAGHFVVTGLGLAISFTPDTAGAFARAIGDGCAQLAEARG